MNKRNFVWNPLKVYAVYAPRAEKTPHEKVFSVIGRRNCSQKQNQLLFIKFTYRNNIVWLASSMTSLQELSKYINRSQAR